MTRKTKYSTPKRTIRFAVSAERLYWARFMTYRTMTGSASSQIVVSEAQNKSKISVGTYGLKYGAKRRNSSAVERVRPCVSFKMISSFLKNIKQT